MCTCWSAGRSLHPETVCWLLGRSLGTCSSSTSLARVKISCVFTRVLGEEYFTLHGTWDKQNYDLFITLWSRRCGWEVSASQLLLDVYLQTVRTLLLQLSMCLWSHCHWYASSPTRTDHGVLCSFISPPWCCWVWLMIHQICCIPTLVCCPDTNQACHTGTCACIEGLKPAYTQFFQSFIQRANMNSLLAAMRQTFLKVINNKIQSTGLQPAKWTTIVAAKTCWPGSLYAQ